MAVEDAQLPLELERKIFKMTARLHPDMRYTVLFVARRVLIWIEPLLYQTLIFDEGSKLPSVPMKPPHFFATNTRHIVLQSVDDYTFEVLKLCTGVTHVALCTIGFHDFLHDLRHIQYLSCHSDDVARTVGSTLGGQEAALPVFATLTHLELFDYAFYSSLVEFCACLPALTHLALDANILEEPEDRDGWSGRENLLLQRLTNLNLLVLLAESLNRAEYLASNLPRNLSDVRFVITWFEDWSEGASDCHSYWDVADAFVAQKRRGLIEDTVFLARRH
ncbi:hypothetical protein C8F01DRAFT_1144972 [Mycena amicta]|nr:hypothetical protein C8F01DRAFT_1144972 [Mycena amicta]